MVEPPKEIVVATELPKVPLRMAIRESSQGPSAMEASFLCDSCKNRTIVKIPWDATSLQRQEKMKAALDEHRLICPVGLTEDMRTYRIHYPR